nr:response regulator transcription factor [Kineosporia mesophila]
MVIVPDDELRTGLVTRLRPAGYLIEPARTGAEALEVMRRRRIDLIVVDEDMPDSNELADRRPQFADRPPVVCMTACESIDRILPELGTAVEDYVTKPYRVVELLARMQVLLRDRDSPRLEPVLRHGDLRLDESLCRAWRGERSIDVTPAEYRLLRHLLLNAGQVLSKEQLAWQVGGSGAGAVERLVSRLRRKVDAYGPALIHTHRGFGYRLGFS